MQNRYVGDVGDFGKYGLLRHLLDDSNLKLGVAWYRYPDEGGNSDGKHTAYLQQARFRCCDPELHYSLKSKILDSAGRVRSEMRNLATLESMLVLPRKTVYHSVPLSYRASMPWQVRLMIRRHWLGQALQTTESADVVFVDPDNGLECKSVSVTSKRGPKFVYWSDLAAFSARGQSLIVYHHLNRSKAARDQVADKLTELKDRLPNGYNTTAVIFRRGTCRAYFVAAAPCHAAHFETRIDSFLVTPWKEHFESVSPPHLNRIATLADAL